MAGAGDILGDAYVNVMAETGQLQAGLARAQNMVTGALSNIGKTLMIGVGAGLAAAVGTGIAGVWAWAKEETSVVDLTSSIKMLGGSLDELMPRYERVAVQIQQNTTIADDATRSAMAFAASMGAPVDRLDEMAQAAAGLSARLGMPMRTAMMLLARSLTSGMFTLFTRYGLTIDKTRSKAEQFNQVLEFAYKGFGKQADMANTLSGRLTQLKNNIGDLMEALGKKIAERLQLKEIADEISKRMYRIVQVFSVALDQIKPGTFSLEKIGKTFEDIIIKMTAFIHTLPAAISILREGFSQNWRNMIDTLLTAGQAFGELIKQAFRIAVMALYPYFEAFGNIMAVKLNNMLSKIFIMGKPLAEKMVGMRPSARMRLATAESEIATKEEMTYMAGLMKFWWEKLKETANEGTKTTFSSIMEEFDKNYKLWQGRFASYKMTEAKPGTDVFGRPLAQRPWKVGGMAGAEAGRDSTEIFGFTEWWKKAQAAAGRDKLAEDTAENTASIAENTEKTVDILKSFSGITRPFLWT